MSTLILRNSYLNLKQEILNKIAKKGGWVNCHGHFDRAYSVTPELYALANKQRSEKWKANADLRKNSTVDEIYDRMALAIETLLEQGVTATGTFIDVDPDVKDKSIKASMKVRDAYKSSIEIKYLNQSSYGLFDPEARKWFEEGASYVDIIGGLLKADAGRENEH
jgi:cytosine/adenosine deaminase-related metal-dependent hydrolase